MSNTSAPVPSEILSPEGIRTHLAEGFRQIPILTYPSVDSTNTQAKRLAAEGAAHGTLIVAEEQTAGRGRLGRSFHSPGQSGLYMSLILRLGEAAQVVGVTVAAAVAVCRSLREVYGREAQIKWVNDIFLGGRKVCGILTEAVPCPDGAGGSTTCLVVGVGINLRPPEGGFSPEAAQVAGAVLPEGCGRLMRNQVAAGVVSHMLALGQNLGDRSEYLPEYRARSLVLGRELSYTAGNLTRQARAVEITDDGELVVELPDGHRETLRYGEVSLRSSGFTA